MKQKSIAELGHNDLLPVYEPYFAEMPISHDSQDAEPEKMQL